MYYSAFSMLILISPVVVFSLHFPPGTLSGTLIFPVVVFASKSFPVRSVPVISPVTTLTLTESAATKDYESGGISCKAGEEIVLLNGKLVAASTDWCDCIINGLKAVPDIDDVESCVIFRGDNTPDEYEAILEERLAEAFPMLEATFVYGGQSVYRCDNTRLSFCRLDGSQYMRLLVLLA